MPPLTWPQPPEPRNVLAVPRYLLLNGPNLNLLGIREPETYGSTTFAELEELCRGWAAELDSELDSFQSNHEGELIDRLQEARTTHDGVVFNAGAFTHTSYALADAITAVDLPTVEVHISNVMEREAWRRTSVMGPACVGSVYGRGIEGYRWGMRLLHHRREWTPETVHYGESDDQVIDIRRPSTPGPHPAVVLVHGGFWRHMWTRDTMDGIAVDLARRGFLTANVEYRRVGAGGGWPQSVDDVRNAIGHILDHEDVTETAVIGHSAGAHLAFLAASQVDLLAVSLGGVLDMKAAVETGLGGNAAAAFLGDADPRDASPLIHPPTRTLVVHGADDDRVPLDQARAFAAAIPTTLIELPDTGHFEFLERSSDAWATVLDELTRQLSR